MHAWQKQTTFAPGSQARSNSVLDFRPPDGMLTARRTSSSAVEQPVYTRSVGGSIPSSCTNPPRNFFLSFCGFGLGLAARICDVSGMRALLLVLCLAVFSVKVTADPLSPADREALLENLEKLRGTVTGRVDARFRAAILAYRTAMVDEKSAIEFYLKCVRKVNFEERHRKASEFNDWKKREDDHLIESTMRRALMHQLRWLVLTLQAASDKADATKLAVEGQQIVDDLFRDSATLTSQQEILGQNVTGTVFARAYEIGAVKLEKWPFSPIHLAQIYEAVLLPQYRATGDIQALRAGWLKRIRQEAVIYEDAHAKSKSNGRPLTPDAGHSPAQDKFLTETLPTLQWQMETDLFRSGDQRGAALRMIAHLEKHLTHPHAKDWSDELKNLLSPPLIVSPSTVSPSAVSPSALPPNSINDLPKDPYSNP